MKLIKALSFLIFCLATLTFTSCSKDNDETKKDPSISEHHSESELRAESLEVNSEGLSTARIRIKTVHGDIIFGLYPKQAPNTVSRIMHLVNEGFYDGLTFHRVVPDFVVQGGDPEGTGTGGSGQKLQAEFSEIQHIRGTVAMARSQDINSADSQFYIALSTLPHLDGQYTVFGQVTDGMENLDKISAGDKMISVTLEK